MAIPWVLPLHVFILLFSLIPCASSARIRSQTVEYRQIISASLLPKQGLASPLSPFVPLMSPLGSSLDIICRSPNFRPALDFCVLILLQSPWGLGYNTISQGLGPILHRASISAEWTQAVFRFKYFFKTLFKNFAVE